VHPRTPRRGEPVLAALISLATVVAAACAPIPQSPTLPPVSSPAVGVVVELGLRGLGDVASLRLRLDDGRILDLAVGTVENAVEFPPSHLAEMKSLGLPVRVFFRDEAGRSVAYRFEHVEAMDGSAVPSGSTVPASASPSPAGSTSAGAAVQVVLVSASAWPGGTTVLFTLDEADNTVIEAPDAAVVVTATEVSAPAGQVPVVVSADARFVRVQSSDRPLYAVDLDLVRPGTWHLDVTATIDGVRREGATPLTVSNPGATPGRGDPAPNIHTPTAADVDGNLSLIVGPPFADPRFYDTSVDQAIAQGIPFVLVLDSAKWRTSLYCGLAISMIQRVAREWRQVTFMHVEPFATTVVAGALVLDPPEGAVHFSASAQAWGLGLQGIEVQTSPWVFVVDGTGRVQAKFQGIIGSDELEVALLKLTGG